MESITSQKPASAAVRQLATLKIVSRLLAHELHAQSSSKAITLSRDAVVEVQTCIDLYIEEAGRQRGSTPSLTPVEPQLAVARSN